MWNHLTMKDLQRFQREFLENGTVRIVDGDKQTVG